MYTEDLAAMTVTVAHKRVKKPEPLLALPDGMREPFYSFNIAQCSFTTLKKKVTLLIVFTEFANYYYCFSITTWIINHAGWEKCTVSLQ